MKKQALVMVSSVIGGFEQVRAAAKSAIEESGHRPLLVNEGLSAVPDSSRNVCLNAVEAADIFVLLIGSNEGWTAPSGMTVVEEEFQHARKRKKPILAFIQDVERTPSTQRLVDAVEKYVSGVFRSTFSTPEGLADALGSALKQMESAMQLNENPSSKGNEMLASQKVLGNSPRLGVALVPVRDDEVFTPMAMESQKLRDNLVHLAHDPKIGLLSYRIATRVEVGVDSIVIINGSERNESARVAITERGVLSAQFDVIELGDDMRNVFASMVVREGNLKGLIEATIRFYGAVLEDSDPHCRYDQAWLNACLHKLGGSLIVKELPKGNYFNPSMHSVPDPLFAYPEARRITRGDMADPVEEAERLALQMGRKSRADKSNTF